MERLKSCWRAFRNLDEREPFNTYGYLFFSMFCALAAFQLTHNQHLFNLLVPTYTVLYIVLFVRFTGKGYPKGQITKRALAACLIVMVAGIQLSSF